MLTDEIQSRSILSKRTEIEPRFWSAYRVDAYESTLSYAFDSKRNSHSVKIKMNAVKLLAKRFASSKPLKDIVGIGERGEPYGEAEKPYELTRGILKILSQYQYPVHLKTSSELILRDTDILSKIADDSMLHITLVSEAEEPLYKRIYPNSSNILILLKRLKQSLPNAYISVELLPLIPELSDDMISLQKEIESLKKMGANTVYVEYTKDLNKKQTQDLCDMMSDQTEILQLLQTRFELEMDEDKVISNGIVISQDQRSDLSERVSDLLKENVLDIQAPRYIPKDYRYSNYELAQRLFKRAKLSFELVQKKKIIEVATSLQNLRHAVTEEELELMSNQKSVKRDIDYFLVSGEFKSFGQARLL